MNGLLNFPFQINQMVPRGDDQVVFLVNDSDGELVGRGVVQVDAAGIPTVKTYQSQLTLQVTGHPAPAVGDQSVVAVQQAPDGVEVVRLGGSLQQEWRRRLTSSPALAVVGVDGKVTVIGGAYEGECLAGQSVVPDGAGSTLFMATYAY
jgi:hypothetical protein